LVGEIYTVTNPAVTTDLLDIRQDSTNDGAVLEGGIVLSRTGVGAEAGAGANCIALEDINATGGAKAGTFLVRAAIVNKGNLTYGNGTVAVVDALLLALGIVAKTSVV
jgi:hypothetical protein